MTDKSEFVLHSSIKAYIKYLEPIGSSHLKNLYNLTYSPATIRGYFRQLADEGYLTQEHISSGRVPSIIALEGYWYNKLTLDNICIDSKKLLKVALSLDLTILIQNQDIIKLNNIYNVDDKFIILDFIDFSISIKYINSLYRFITDLIGLDIDDILKISKQVGATQLFNEIDLRLKDKIFRVINIDSFLDIALKYHLDKDILDSFYRGDILGQLEQNIYFEELLPKGYISICHNCLIDNKPVKILIVGELAKDYEYFYQNILKDKNEKEK